MATQTIMSADTLTGEPFVLRMPSHEAGLELAAARLLAAEFRVSTAEVDELLCPPQAALLQAAEDERRLASPNLYARSVPTIGSLRAHKVRTEMHSSHARLPFGQKLANPTFIR